MRFVKFSCVPHFSVVTLSFIIFYPFQSKKHGVTGIDMEMINVARTLFAGFRQRATGAIRTKKRGRYGAGTPGIA
jgi:hypothetical protein